jgi:hypothetical protein
MSSNNHGYLMSSVKMAWGVVSGDDAAFAQGVERYFMALHQIHDDGGFKWEVGRGACAIRYQALATANVVALAEIAASQGYDLYALEVEGRTIHTAIQFLVDALMDPSLVRPYADTATGVCHLPPGSPQDLGGLTRPWNDGTTNLAFLEQYIARFPDTPLAGRLRAVWPGGLAQYRPLSNMVNGLNTSCGAVVDQFVRVSVAGPIETIPASGGSGFVAIRSTSATFGWAAESSADWVSVPTPRGTGNADLAFHVGPNDTGIARTATITIGNQVLLISQAGAVR